LAVLKVLLINSVGRNDNPIIDSKVTTIIDCSAKLMCE